MRFRRNTWDSTSRCPATTTFRGWPRRGMRRMRGRCWAPSPTPPSESSCSPTSPARRCATTRRSSRRRPPPCRSSPTAASPSGLGSGENLNEHVVGKRWPTVARRQDMLREAIQIIRELFTGELVDWKGEYFEVDSARLWDIPDTPVAIATAVSGERSVETFAPLVRPPDRRRTRTRNSSTRGMTRGARPACRRRYASSGRSRSAGIPTATPRCVAPTTSSGGSAAGGRSTPTCRRPPASTARRSSCVPRTSPSPSRADRISTRSSRRSSKYWKAGFTDIALVQIGDEGQEQFLEEAAAPLLDKLRTAAN